MASVVRMFFSSSMTRTRKSTHWMYHFPVPPALFVSHGSPMVALDDDDYNRSLSRFAADIPRPSAIVCISAHWEAGGPIRVTGAAARGTIHDFGGFPDALYELRYPAPGDPALAADVASRVGGVVDGERGLDHGVWVPLRFLYPRADVPVVAVSLPFGR